MDAETNTPIDKDHEEFSRWAQVLGYGGLIPFFAAAIASWTLDEPLLGIDPIDAGRAYGAVILSFLGGIRWGLALTSAKQIAAEKDLAISVAPSVAAWAALLLPALPGLVILLAGFIAQLYWDMRAHRKGLIPQWFKGLRVQLTFGAVIGLLAMLPEVG